MKKSEFRKNYIILANLYGAISIEEAYNVLRHYYNDLSYDSLYNDCKARVERQLSLFNMLSLR